MIPATARSVQTAAVQLSLRLAAAPATPVAWFISGGSPDEWLEELCAWGVPLNTVRLLPVPSSSKDRVPVGVLALTAGAPPATCRGLPYTCRAGRLYLPVEAALHPPVSDDEVRAICPWAIACFHPSIGLIAGSEADLLVATHLLQMPTQCKSDWNLALPGIASEPRIRSVHPVQPPSTTEVFAVSRDDIGRQPAEKLPPTEDESLTKQMARRAQLGWAKALRKLIPQGQASETAGFLGKLRQWAEGKTQELQEKLDAARQREISRLVNLLEKDPDEGLRFALPLHALPSARGSVQGGATLAPHGTDFSLGRLFGSRPTASWESPFDAQEKLRTRYRELATRELALGRFRRAAYIFGELLGDFGNAANALEQGRFFREAAVLYRDKLSNPALAASCLERGGLLSEAAQMYVQMQRFEKAGDLFRTLGNEEEASRLYGLAVELSRDKGDLLAVARIYENKLNQADQALESLTAAWPDSNQAAECLREMFQLLARVARFEEMEKRIRSFRDAARHPSKPLLLANVLLDVAHATQNKPVRDLATDTARVIAGYELSRTPAGLETRSLLGIVTRCCMEDRLLYRDTSRFLDVNKDKGKAIKPSPTPPALRSPHTHPCQIRRLGTLTLDKSVHWKAAATVAGGFVAVGTSERDEVIVTRATWAAPVQTLRLRLANADLYNEFRLAVTDTLLIIAPLGTTTRIPAGEFPAASGFPRMHVSPDRLLPPGNLYGVAIGEEGDLHLVYASPEGAPDQPMIYERRRADGTTISSHTLPMQEPQDGELRTLWMCAHADSVAFTHLDRLDWQSRGMEHDAIALPGAAFSMAGPAPLTASRFAIGLDDGGAAIVWPRQSKVVPFANDVFDARTLIMREGFVVAMGDRHALVYEITAGAPRQVAAMNTDTHSPAAIFQSRERNQFAALHANGHVELFEVK